MRSRNGAGMVAPGSSLALGRGGRSGNVLGVGPGQQQALSLAFGDGAIVDEAVVLGAGERRARRVGRGFSSACHQPTSPGVVVCSGGPRTMSTAGGLPSWASAAMSMRVPGSNVWM